VNLLKKTVAIFAALLTLLMISPAAAAPKSKSQFESTVIFNVQYQIMQDGMMHVYAVEAITINGADGPVLVGDLSAKMSWTVDPNTGQGSFRGDFTIGNEIGSFEGNAQGTLITDSQGATGRVSGSLIGFGTGYYARQKIRGTFDGSAIYGILQVTLKVNGLIQSK
jgi:hypothetical protein